MRARFLSIVAVAAAVAFLGIARADDDAKKADKPEAKKDCKDGAKDDCGDDCCSKPAEKVTAKQMECADCAKQAGPCAKCDEMVKSGAVSVVPIKGMMCPSCENKIAVKLDKVDQLAKFLVSSSKNVAVLLIAPGKALKLSELTKALEGTPGKVDEEAALVGRVNFTIDCPPCPECEKGSKKCEGCEKGSKQLSDTLGKLAGVEKVSSGCCEKTKACFFTLQLAKDSKVSIKQLRDTVASTKMVTLADLVFFGAPEEAKKPTGT